MRRTSILLDPGLLAELERLGRRQGRPTAHVIRDALERYVAAQGEERSALPGFVGLGRARSGEPVERSAIISPEVQARLDQPGTDADR